MLHKWLPQEGRQAFTEYTLCGRPGAARCGAPHQCCRKGDPFQGPKLGSCLTLGNELSEETHVPSKRFYWEREPGWRAGGWGNPGGLLCHVACSLQFYGDGISFWVVFSQSFWLRVLPGGAHLVQPSWMPEKRILGGGQTCGVSFWPFLNSSGWWWPISSVFLTRTSCCKTTHAYGYYGAWPGRAVSVSVLPLTPRSPVQGFPSRPQMQRTRPKSSLELTEPQGNHWQPPIAILPGQAPEPILGKTTHPSTHPTVP